MVLAEYAPGPLDLPRAVTMLLLHDVVEIDAGDTFCYDEAANGDKASASAPPPRAHLRLLPPEQGDACAPCGRSSSRAKPRGALRQFPGPLQVLFQNATPGRHLACTTSPAPGRATHGAIRQGLPALWPVVQSILDDRLRQRHPQALNGKVPQ